MNKENEFYINLRSHYFNFNIHIKTFISKRKNLDQPGLDYYLIVLL